MKLRILGAPDGSPLFRRIDLITGTQIVLHQALDPKGRLYFDRATGRQLVGIASPLTFKAQIDPVDLVWVDEHFPRDCALPDVGT